MAKLITHHDPYHVHKVLGLLVLIHYLYRFYCLWETGAAFALSFSQDDDDYDQARLASSSATATRDVACLALHALLSWSSLLLPLPKVRNFKSPMIWPEFRFHSIVFATRHVLTTIASLGDLWPNKYDVVCNSLARGAIVLGTVGAASYVTTNYGCRENRTTNAMPYPEHVTESQQLAIKKLYTSAQFGATVTALMNDPTMNFAPLLGIQMAPLLMTLVRKGKVSTYTYHRVYAVSLSLGYVAIFWRLIENVGTVWGAADTFRALFLFSLPFKKLRRYITAQTFWTIAIIFSCVLYPLMLEDVVESHVSVATLRKLIWIVFVRTLANQVITYAPLFVGGGSNKQANALLHRAMQASQSVLTSCGMGGLAWNVGIFWFVQCYSATEVTGEVTDR